MSFSFQEGKDIVHFITEEDLKEYNDHIEQEEKEEEERREERAVSDEVHEQYPGAVNEKGEINWECPCLGGLGTEGPCVEEFKSAFSCWMFSSSDEEQGKEKGDECVDNFFRMSVCMQQNEEFYDDLNARNKAAAEEARAKYEAEERGALAAAEQEQKVLEAIAASEENESESRGESESESRGENESESKGESESKEEECPLAAPASEEIVASPVSYHVVYESGKDDFGGIPSTSTVIVAAKTEEEEEDEKENTEDED